MSTIEKGLFTKLSTVFGHNRIYPEQIPMQENQDDGSLEANTMLPALSYRLVSGDRLDTFQGEVNWKTDSFLIEIFDRVADDLQDLREVLFSEFTGPPIKSKVGFPLQWETGGLWITWAVATNPTVDTEYTTKDAHDVLRYVQALLTITYR